MDSLTLPPFSPPKPQSAGLKNRPKELKLTLDPERVETAMEFQLPEEAAESISTRQKKPEIENLTPSSKPKRTPSHKSIEDVLMQKQQLSKKRLQALKMQYDKKALEDMQACPTISEKSRELANKADLRFFTRHQVAAGELWSKPPLIISTEIDVQSQNLWEMVVPATSAATTEKLVKDLTGFEYSPTFSDAEGFIFPKTTKHDSELIVLKPSGLKERIEGYLATSTEKKPALSSKTRLRHLSADMQYFLKRHQPLVGPVKVAERNKEWNHSRERKIEEKRTHLEQKSLLECTFTPILYTKIPHHMHTLSAGDLVEFEASALNLTASTVKNQTERRKMMQVAQTPKSQRSTATHTRVHSLVNPPQDMYKTELRHLTPVHTPVAYRDGFNISRFLHHAKLVEKR